MDLRTQLRDSRSVHLAKLHILMEQAADELCRLQSAISEYTEGVSERGESKSALTAAEREAVLDAALAYEGDPDEWECAKIAATLRGLLERLG